MSEKGLQILAKKSLIPFAKGTSLNPCDFCLFGKQHRVSFNIPSTRKLNVLDLVYSDVCGPIDVETLGILLHLLMMLYERCGFMF